MSDRNDWTDDAVDELYAEGRETAPAELDEAVLAYAAKKQAAPSTKRRRLWAGSGAIASAAVLVLTVAVFFRGGEDVYAPGAASDEALPSSPPLETVRAFSLDAPASQLAEPEALEEEALPPAVPAPVANIATGFAKAADTPAAAPARERLERNRLQALTRGLPAEARARRPLPTNYALSYTRCPGTEEDRDLDDAPPPCALAVAADDCLEPYFIESAASVSRLEDVGEEKLLFERNGEGFTLSCTEGAWRLAPEPVLKP